MPWSASWTGYKRLRFIINCLTRMRMVTHNGHLNLTFSGSPWPRSARNLLPWFQRRRPPCGKFDARRLRPLVATGFDRFTEPDQPRFRLCLGTATHGRAARPASATGLSRCRGTNLDRSSVRHSNANSFCVHRQRTIPDPSQPRHRLSSTGNHASPSSSVFTRVR